MTTITNSFEGGTSGTTITSANSGGTSGTAFDIVTGATATFDTTHAAHGTKSAKFTASSGAVWWSAASSGLTGQADGWFRAYLYLPAYPSSTGEVLEDASGNFRIILNSSSTGTISLQNTNSFGEVTTTTQVPLNSWCRIECHIKLSTTGAGIMELKLFNSMDSSTPTETQTATGQTFSDANFTGNDFGFGTNSFAWAEWLDDLGVSSTGYIGPAVPAFSGSATTGVTLTPTATGIVNNWNTGVRLTPSISNVKKSVSGSLLAQVTLHPGATGAKAGSIIPGGGALPALPAGHIATAADMGQLTDACTFLLNKPLFRAHWTASTALSTTYPGTIVNFGGVDYDTDQGYASPTFTIKTQGFYWGGYMVDTNSPANSICPALRITTGPNNPAGSGVVNYCYSSYAYAYGTTTPHAQANGCGVIPWYLYNGDKVAVICQPSTAANAVGGWFALEYASI